MSPRPMPRTIRDPYALSDLVRLVLKSMKIVLGRNLDNKHWNRATSGATIDCRCQSIERFPKVALNCASEPNVAFFPQIG